MNRPPRSYITKLNATPCEEMMWFDAGELTYLEDTFNVHFRETGMGVMCYMGSKIGQASYGTAHVDAFQIFLRGRGIDTSVPFKEEAILKLLNLHSPSHHS